jgi:hypothetical protein
MANKKYPQEFRDCPERNTLGVRQFNNQSKKIKSLQKR